MQSDHQLHRSKELLPHLGDEMANDGNNMHIPYASASDPLFPPCGKPMPIHGIEFQTSEVCPKNFIVFDQTTARSQVLYHPTLTRKLKSPALNVLSSSLRNNYIMEDVNNFDKETSSSLQEDSDEIDALLSLEEEEEENESDEEEEEVSSTRTYGNNSPDSSCSSYGCHDLRKNSYGSSVSSCKNGEKRRQKMKKMMRVLRGIVPGGEQMNTASVLDEAVEYLKSLKVEAQKLGVGNLKN